MLFPRPQIPPTTKGYTLSKGVYSFPFNVQFPVFSVCPQQLSGTLHPIATLPPSFYSKTLDPRGYASILYWLEVCVQRPGRLRRNGLLEQGISFLPLDPTLPPPMISPAEFRHHGRYVMLEATFPSPSVLFVGSTIPLRLFTVDSTIPAQYPPSITLRSLTIGIQTHTTVVADKQSNTWTSSQDIVCISGIEQPVTNLRSRRTEISSDLWRSTVLPKLVPSFTTCTVSQQYSLQVTATFAHDSTNTTDVQYLLGFWEENTNISVLETCCYHQR